MRDKLRDNMNFNTVLLAIVGFLLVRLILQVDHQFDKQDEKLMSLEFRMSRVEFQLGIVSTPPDPRVLKKTN